MIWWCIVVSSWVGWVRCMVESKEEWIAVREKYCWLAGGWCWFGMREKHYWLVGWQAKRTEWVFMFYVELMLDQHWHCTAWLGLTGRQGASTAQPLCLKWREWGEENSVPLCYYPSVAVFPPRSISNPCSIIFSCFTSECIVPENQDNCNGTHWHMGNTYELLWTFKVAVFDTHFFFSACWNLFGWSLNPLKCGCGPHEGRDG